MLVEEDRWGLNLTEVYLISHGESEMSLRQDLINGRCQNSGLTPNGKRQARALAVFLNSQGVRFNAVYSSPLDRAKDTAASVCQEMSFPEQQIQPIDALSDMSHGQWEGCPRSEMYTPEILALIDRLQPDFSAPSGESLRQVEFRMVEFLNRTLLVLPEKLKPDFSSPRPNNSGPQWDLLHRHHRQLLRKKSGKSRLQVVVTNYPSPEDEVSSPNEPSSSRKSSIDVGPTTSGVTSSSSCVGVFSHSVPIKCLLTGILGCSPVMSSKLCIEDSSVTVLQHSWRTGWQIKRLNETSHLRLL